MNEEIMVNEEVIEAVEEMTPASTGIGGKVAIGLGLTALVGTVVYKFVVKPLVEKRKAKKEEQKEVIYGTLIDEPDDCDDVEQA